MFQLMLMSIAPIIFSNDHWIQYITGQPVEWIPAHHTRLLHPNTLLRPLRSELGAHCMQQWREAQWQGHLLDILEALQQLDGFYPRRLVRLAASRRRRRGFDASGVLTVNTNGIKQNGHLLIENLLSRHSFSCLQEAKFGDATRLSTFKIHLDSSLDHKVFVNDPNSHQHRPTRERSNGVVIVLRSEFPGFNSAVVVSRLSVTGRYLVVRVLVDGFPLHLHNVYAPIDRQEKCQFFSGLVTEEFEDHATHIVLEDLNTPLDPRLDSSTPDLRYDPGRSSCLERMAKLGVVDTWMIHFDT
uniref:Endonuclease/exonuclease/phosphatase domain-containing protein n=1 Tax=Peronospora matthiolae TaxID=2874970 RepID=A0AAV1UGB9_9STRA